MSEAVRKRRRRWPWMVLAALVLVGGPLGWRFRPMNGAERQLVGTWEESPETREDEEVLDESSGRFVPERTLLRFTAARRFAYWTDREPYHEHASWSASATSLKASPDLGTMGLTAWLSRAVTTRASSIRFVDRDHVWIDEHLYVRVPE